MSCWDWERALILDLRGDLLTSCVRVEGEVLVELGPSEIEGERKEEYVVVLISAGFRGQRGNAGIGEASTRRRLGGEVNPRPEYGIKVSNTSGKG